MNGNSSRREPAGGAVLRPANPFRASLIALASAAVALVAGYQLSAQISRSFQSAALSAPGGQPASAPVAAARSQQWRRRWIPSRNSSLEVQPGDTLDSLFRATSLSLVDLAEILQLDVARKYLRVLRPGDVLHVRHDDGAILELDRELDIRSKLEIQRADGGLRGQCHRAAAGAPAGHHRRQDPQLAFRGRPGVAGLGEADHEHGPDLRVRHRFRPGHRRGRRVRPGLRRTVARRREARRRRGPCRRVRESRRPLHRHPL